MTSRRRPLPTPAHARSELLPSDTHPHRGGRRPRPGRGAARLERGEASSRGGPAAGRGRARAGRTSWSAPESWSARLAGFPRLLLRDERVDLQFGFFPPEKIDRDLNRLRGLLGGSPPTLILCDNEGQLERLEELLEEGGRGVRATLAIGALDGGFVMPSLRVLTDHEIFRRARRLRRPRRYRQAAPSAATGALVEGDYVVHLDHGIGIYRGITDDHRGRVDARGGHRRVRRRRPAQRPALPPRSGRAVSRGRRGWRPPAAADPPAGRLVLGPRPREDPPRDQADGGGAARAVRPADRHAAATRFRPTSGGSGSSNRASSTRTRPTSGRPRKRSRPTWSGHAPWTGCWWAT